MQPFEWSNQVQLIIFICCWNFFSKVTTFYLKCLDLEFILENYELKKQFKIHNLTISKLPFWNPRIFFHFNVTPTSIYILHYMEENVDSSPNSYENESCVCELPMIHLCTCLTANGNNFIFLGSYNLTAPWVQLHKLIFIPFSFHYDACTHTSCFSAWR
jgi:hypothetical protein